MKKANTLINNVHMNLPLLPVFERIMIEVYTQGYIKPLVLMELPEKVKFAFSLKRSGDILSGEHVQAKHRRTVLGAELNSIGPVAISQLGDIDNLSMLHSPGIQEGGEWNDLVSDLYPICTACLR